MSLPFVNEEKMAMSFKEFVDTIQWASPPEFRTPLLSSLWFDAKGNWDKAHEIAQSVHTARGSWVHAYLHWKQGDMANAQYWYARAGKGLPMIQLEEEWEKICSILLQGS